MIAEARLKLIAHSQIPIIVLAATPSANPAAGKNPVCGNDNNIGVAIGAKGNRNTRSFIRIMFALSMLLPLSSIVTSVYCFLGYDMARLPGLWLRLVMLAASQMMDFSAFIISIDCVVASTVQNQKPLFFTTLASRLTSLFSYGSVTNKLQKHELFSLTVPRIAQVIIFNNLK
uniref:G_PROTEIN_RECEP_F1_2 domain-containing protein n=1 Tax=Panagrellus redivivus TaxID=6233 RepID=A0A7E4WA04_PANRE